MGKHVFFCYARQDAEFAMALAKNLKNRGVKIWLDQWDIAPGANWDKSIDSALYECAELIIVLSPNSVSSAEVMAELRVALNEQKHIVPVIYRPCQVPRQLLLIQQVNFTDCQPDDESTLEHLIGVLEVFEPKHSINDKDKETVQKRTGEEGNYSRSPIELDPHVAKHKVVKQYDDVMSCTGRVFPSIKRLVSLLFCLKNSGSKATSSHSRCDSTISFR
jgi:hypothetical protein